MSLFGKKTRLIAGPLVCCLGLLVLFFSVTDPTSWPQHTTQLSASDMRTAPAVSTVWCESLVLIAQHDFVAYKTAKAPSVSNKFTRNTVEHEMDVDAWKIGVVELRYYLLKGSVISVQACATEPKSYIHVYRGKVRRSCFREGSGESESDESDSDESGETPWTLPAQFNVSGRVPNTNCPLPMSSLEIPATLTDGVSCSEALPLTVAVDESDEYALFFANNQQNPTRIKLKVVLDRTTYNVNDSKRSTYMCSAGSLCIVQLSFASLDRTVLWIPPDPNSGRNQFSIYSRCRPRVEFFAVLTILLPIALMFIVVCVVVKSKESGLQNRYNMVNVSYQDRTSPLLVGYRGILAEQGQRCLSRQDEPPSYDMIIAQAQPPPYSSLKLG